MKTLFYASAAVLVLSAVLYGLKSFQPEAKPGSSERPVSQTLPDRGAEFGEPAASKPLSIANQTASEPARLESSSKADLIEKLTLRQDPGSAFEAYKIIRTCVESREDQLHVAEHAADGLKERQEKPDAACGNISPGQVASRDQLLKKAALAGVHGAAEALLLEGPTGEGNAPVNDPNSPEVIAFNDMLLAAWNAGAKHGDLYSLRALATRAEMLDQSSPNYAEALKYTIAANDVSQQQTGRDIRHFEGEVERLKSKLNTQQISEATQAGHIFALGVMQLILSKPLSIAQ